MCQKHYEKLRAIPKHATNNTEWEKTLDAQPTNKKIPHETPDKETKGKTKPKRECQSLSFVAKKTYGIQKKKTWLKWTHGNYATIVKDIMNYV